MNKISKEKINKILKDDYKYLKTLYPQDQIFGLFTFGKVNYGFAEKVEDILVKMYYLPSLEEMCTSIEFKDEVVEYNNHQIIIKDIRLILDNILKQEGTTMECFFSENYIITPKFKTVYMDNIIAKREEIFHCNPKKRVEQSVNRAFEDLKVYLSEANTERLFEACRRRLAISLYLAGEAVQDCIQLKKDYHRTYLWSIKSGQSLPNIEEVVKDLEEMKNRASIMEVHPELEAMVTETIVEIMKIALTKSISADEFLSMLTPAEQGALKDIMQNLNNGEGVVSVSKLVESGSYSRPVYKSVLNKMKDAEIADLTNMGVKGTHIKIIDGVFLNIDEYID